MFAWPRVHAYEYLFNPEAAGATTMPNVSTFKLEALVLRLEDFECVTAADLN